MVLTASVVGASDADLPVADFEGADYGNWAVTGEAFGSGPAKGALPGQMPVDGFEGKGLVNSFHKGDASTGTLTSPEFVIERRFLRFLIGGGGWEGRTCLNLKIAGKTVRTATGPNTDPGGSERLELQVWDVEEFRGRRVRLEMVDAATEGWGHVNVDHIVQTNTKPAGALEPARRILAAEKHWLHLPVKNGAKKRVMTVSADGAAVRSFDIELADGEPDWWAFLDISAWKGKSLTLAAGRMAADSRALEAIRQSDAQPGADSLYAEALRPQFHFSARRGWLNDPNGLVLYRGEYHLFFQHNPYGWNWGNMHWGHAVSRDLVRWEEVGEALYPDESGTMFSGSAVVDAGNTSGFGTEQQPAMVLFYTAAGREFTQNLAYSTDGRTFKKYERNPVVKQITHGNRDPKVIWHQPSRQWIMTLYVEVEKVHTIQLLRSQNLKDWTVVSEVPDLFECPDFFPLRLPGAENADAERWVITGASSEYLLGGFDGVRFHPETPKLPGHRGKGFYAAQTFSDVPGRRVQIGWGQMPSPGMPFNQLMCFPTTLTLVSTEAGPRMAWAPVEELGSLREKQFPLQPGPIAPGKNGAEAVHGELLEIQLLVEPRQAKEVRLDARGAVISWNAERQELAVNEHRVPAPLREGKIDLHVLVDRTSLEVFACGGTVYVPTPFVAKPEAQSVRVSATGGEALLKAGDVWRLRSIWPRKH